MEEYLSFGGRITLLKSVLSMLPVYFLSAFRCPSKVIDSLEKIEREFLWGSSPNNKKNILLIGSRCVSLLKPVAWGFVLAKQSIPLSFLNGSGD